MGVYAGPANAWSNFRDSNRIDASTKLAVQSGLVLNLDAGASTSYPGSGTTWTDLSDKISTATGALPIYNTTDNGAVKGTGTRTDSLSSSLQLCIPCGAQSGLDLNDLSVTGRSSSLQTVTNNGVVNVTSTSKFYGGTGNFSGAATQWASVPNDGRYNLASRQYTTIEFWYRCDSTGGSKGILATGSYNSTGWEIYVNANGGCDLVVWNGTTGISDVRTGTATLGVWHHCAFIINYTAGTTTVTPYLDGVTSGSSSIASAFPNVSANLYIGRRNTWPGGDSGTLYLQDIRVYSTIKYTANFTPPGNPNNGTLTNGPTYNGANYGSIAFDGSNDYVALPSIDTNSNFTLNFWVKSSSDGSPTIFSGNAASGYLQIRMYSSFISLVKSYVVELGNFGSSTATTLNSIHNITITKSGTTFSAYVNGNFKNTLTVAQTFTTTGQTLGINSSNSEPFSGNIYSFSYYNRALSAAEVSQNFNALRSRFGI